jgi:hypothetical protein
MRKLTNGKTYAFYNLEKRLGERKPGTYALVENVQYGGRAIMHIFRGNFCGDWLSGDAVLFYADGETHSANEGDEFKLISIHHPDNKQP